MQNTEQVDGGREVDFSEVGEEQDHLVKKGPSYRSMAWWRESPVHRWKVKEEWLPSVDQDVHEWESLMVERRREWAVMMMTLEMTCLEWGMFVCSREHFQRRKHVWQCEAVL